MDGRKQVTVPETVTLGEKERKAPFPLKGKGPNDDDDYPALRFLALKDRVILLVNKIEKRHGHFARFLQSEFFIGSLID